MDESIQIPGYSIEKEIGSGAMAVVYLAIQDALERPVALKIMSSSLKSDDTFQKRFLKEGKIIAQLNHPNIVTIYDIGVVDSHNYMAMEYVDGGVTLRDKIVPGLGLSLEQALAVLVQVASALGYAHKRNFVHRDVKPANILFREAGTAVLSDFGIAKALGEGTAMTRQGWAVGTPSYMSPEQALGRPIDARCDLYCLGVVLYEMLTGNKPYQANDSFAVALKHVHDPIPLLPAQFEHFQSLLERLMAKQPSNRFDSAEDLIKAVSELQAKQGLTSVTATATLPHNTQASTVIQRKPAVSMATDFNSGAAEAHPIHRKPWVWGSLSSIVLLAGLVWLMPELNWRVFNQSLPTGTKIVSVPVSCQREAPLTIQQQQQIDGFWVAIEVNLDEDIERLVSPPVSNAAYGLQEVLKIDPCNERAKQLQARLPSKVLAQIQAHRAEGNIMNALAITKAGLEFFPADAELQRLQQALK